MKLQEIKEQYAKEHGYNSFIDMCPNKALFESASDEISKRYAKAKIEEAAESKENDLFAAYLTGQTDERNRVNGLSGRRFKDWYEENFKQLISETPLD